MCPVASKLSASKCYLGNISLLLFLLVCLPVFFLLEIFNNTSAVLRDCVDAMSTFTSIKSYFCELVFVINTAFYCAHTEESLHKRKSHRRLI